MVVLVMENMPPGLRGEITQWLLETKAGVFVGNISAAVRERIWDKVTQNEAQGSALLLYAADTEQGFQIEMCGLPTRSVIDMEGILLIKTEVGT